LKVASWLVLVEYERQAKPLRHSVAL
jgi:hypothetical protein